MDYAFVNAVKFWGGRLTVVQSFYDVACQWHKNLRTRLAQYQTLRLDWDVIIRYCIGQWHVHGHKKECFTRYSPLFVPGIGWVDGEIIETLWSSLNEVSSSLRAMGTAHRQESMDMHMEDLNMKKMVSIGDHPSHSLLGRCLTNITHSAFNRKEIYQSRGWLLGERLSLHSNSDDRTGEGT